MDLSCKATEVVLVSCRAILFHRCWFHRKFLLSLIDFALIWGDSKPMRGALFTLTILFALVAVSGCRTASSGWDGTWKINTLKSSYNSRIITISILTNGDYRYDAGDLSFVFRCDGKDRAVAKDHTEACVKRSSTSLELIRKEHGVETNTHDWVLSANGMVFTSTTRTLRPNGAVVTGNIVGRWPGQVFHS